MRLIRTASIITMIILVPLLLWSCSKKPGKGEVIIYTSVDQVYSEPMLKKFQEKTGIKVLPVYDVEAAKTTGLVNRLIAEKANPRADVFWNGEFAQTILLKDKGVLEKYKSPSSLDIPSKYADGEGFWTGFGGRARVLLVNMKLIDPSDYPSSIFDLLKSKVSPEKVGIASPIFGTTATHAAALYAELGREKAFDFFQTLKKKGVTVVDGNSVVRDMVVSGQLAMGLTDTDDAFSAVKNGAPVETVFLDQAGSGIGTLVVPNTVAMIKGAPHPDEAKKLIDYLLSREIEKELAESGWIDITIRPTGKDTGRLKNSNIKTMSVNMEDVYRFMEQSKQDMTEIFIR